MRDLEVHAAANSHGERIVRTGESQPAIAADMRDAEKHLAERSQARMTAIGNTRAEKISGERPVNSGAKNIVGVIAAEIGDCAEPGSSIVGELRAAAIHAETIDSRGGRICAHVGISREHIKFRHVLRLCCPAERNKSQ